MYTTHLRESQIAWTQVLNGSTSSTLFPSSLTAGVHLDPAPAGVKIHVAVEANSTAGTSCTVALLGLAPAGQLGASSTWVHVGNINGGSSITPSTSKWSDSTTHVALAEAVSIPGNGYERYTTLVVQGSTNVVSTWVGVSRP